MGSDVIVLKKLEKFNIGELIAILLDTLHGKASCRSSPILNFSNFLSTITAEDDNDNSAVIVLKKLEKFSIGEDLQDALQCNVSRRMAVSSPMLLLLPMMIMITRIEMNVIKKLKRLILKIMVKM